jgi:nicotinamide mononucleotide (NMN) deamidase PncC
MLDDLYESTNPSIAFLISDMEVKVRITAKGDDSASVDSMIAPMEAEVRSRLGEAVFAADEETNLDVIARLLGDRTVGVEEVMTAGIVTERLAGIGGFGGGTVLPAGADAPTLAVSARTGFGADVGLGISQGRLVDDAGEKATLVTIAVSDAGGTHADEMRFFGTGERARSYAAIAALHTLRRALDTAAPSEDEPPDEDR